MSGEGGEKPSGKPTSTLDSNLEKQKQAMAETTQDLRFGFCGWKPSWLQGFNKGAVYVLFMFLSNVFLSLTVNGLVGVVLSNLETRFQLTSSQSSWIASAYEVAAIPVMLAVSLFRHRSHRPRIVAIGLMAMVVGCILFAIPHFTTGTYLPGSDILDHGVCLTEENSYNGTITRDGKSGSKESGQLSSYLVAFILARILQGLGTVPLQTLGVTYLDDIVTKQQFSLYVALYFAGGVLGPAIGYIAGGYMLELFTDFATVNVKELEVTSSDPRWVGAWWLGFLVGGVCLFIVTIPFFGYANDVPDGAEIRANKESEAHGEQSEDAVNEDLSQLSWRELLRLVKTVLTNPCFIFLTLFCISDAFIITGFTNFGPKYVERQFSVSASYAGMLFGLISIPGGVGGTIAGGYIIKRFKLKVPQILKLELGLTFILIASGCCFFIVCDAVDFAGVTTHYINHTSTTGKPELIAPCNQNCSCTDVDYNPVCGADNALYFSPCHAGCVNYDQFPGKSFGNCSCVSSQLSGSPQANKKNCTRPDCTLMPLFMVLFFVGMFIIFFNSGMNCTVTLRIVQNDTRALALGLQGLMTRLVGTFPGPLAFGAAFDRACILWQKTETGTGSCLFYDNQSMSLYLFLVSIGIKVVSIVFITAAWKLYKAPTPPAPQVSYVPNGDVKAKPSEGVDSKAFQPDNYQGPMTTSRL